MSSVRVREIDSLEIALKMKNPAAELRGMRSLSDSRNSAKKNILSEINNESITKSQASGERKNRLLPVKNLSEK